MMETQLNPSVPTVPAKTAGDEAARLLEGLRCRGFSLRHSRGDLLVRPAPDLTPADRDAIRARKAELVALLLAEEQLCASERTWDWDLAHYRPPPDDLRFPDPQRPRETPGLCEKRPRGTGDLRQK